MITGFWLENQKERGHLIDSGIDGGTLNWILKAGWENVA